MPPALSSQDDDDYDSASDSDFDDAELSASSAEEDSEADETTSKAQKREGAKDADGDIEMASGDEGIVAQGRKKKRKKGKGRGKGKGKGGKGDEEQDAEDQDEEDDAPVGVRVRLRSGRGGEEAKRAVLPTISAATADIDLIWARMNNPQASKPFPPPIEIPDDEAAATAASADPVPTPTTTTTMPTTTTTAPQEATTDPLQYRQTTEATIKIPHNYTFAGETHTSTKTVPISSPAAQAYLASIPKTKSSTSQSQLQIQMQARSPGPTLRRPLARKNLLEPNPSRLVYTRGTLPARTDLPLSIGGSRTVNTAAVAEKAGLGGKGKENKIEKGEKLNTVEKSKLDWEAEVDRLGMREELERAEKSGGSYLGRVEFLKRVEGGEEERARVARLKKAGLT